MDAVSRGEFKKKEHESTPTLQGLAYLFAEFPVGLRNGPEFKRRGVHAGVRVSLRKSWASLVVADVVLLTITVVPMSGTNVGRATTEAAIGDAEGKLSFALEDTLGDNVRGSGAFLRCTAVVGTDGVVSNGQRGCCNSSHTVENGAFAFSVNGVDDRGSNVARHEFERNMGTIIDGVGEV